MRQPVTALMAFLVLTLSLACGMASCPVMAAEKAVKAPEAHHATMPCHGAAGEAEAEKADMPMVVADCLGLDFFFASADFDFSPDDNNFDQLDFAPAILITAASIQPENAVTIRGPPGANRYATALPIFLTTQRLRI